MSLKLANAIFLMLLFSVVSTTLNSQTDNTIMNMDKPATSYLKAWNERDETKRTTILKTCFSEAGSYIDPHIPNPINNLEEMNEVINIFHSRLPHQLIATSEIESHNNAFRVKWKLEDKGSVLSRGVFIGVVNSENRISQIISFLDK